MTETVYASFTARLDRDISTQTSSLPANPRIDRLSARNVCMCGFVCPRPSARTIVPVRKKPSKTTLRRNLKRRDDDQDIILPIVQTISR